MICAKVVLKATYLVSERHAEVERGFNGVYRCCLTAAACHGSREAELDIAVEPAISKGGQTSFCSIVVTALPALHRRSAFRCMVL